MLEKYSLLQSRKFFICTPATGCSEKTHVLERVRETILTPIKVAEPVKRPKPERREPSDAKREKDIDDILAKLKNMPGGENLKVSPDVMTDTQASSYLGSICARKIHASAR